MPKMTNAHSHANPASTLETPRAGHREREAGMRKAFIDDRQIVRLEAQKRYGEMDSVDIHVDILWLHT